MGNTTYTLRGVYHGVSTYDDSVTMEFEGETDLTALADRAFIINGKTFWMSGASIPGGIANAQAIVWPEPEWTSAGGWPLGSTVWVGLKVGTSRSRAVPRTTVTRDGNGPVHGPFGIAVTFSEDVNGFDASDIDVVNGELVPGSLTPNGERTWNAQVAPARSGTVTVSVPEGAAEAEGTDNAPSEPLVVEADIAPAQATVRRIGDGPIEGPFSVEVTFSKPVTGLTMDEFDIEGGWATGMASESDGQSHEVLITPNEGAQTITITVPADVAQDANGRGNAASATLRIGAPAPPLEASFLNVPSEHDGKKAFTVKLSLSAEPRGLSYKTVRDSLLEVSCATESCGTVTKALRVTDGSDREWNVTVEPSQAYAITLTLPPRACSETAAVCIGGRPLAEPASATIPGTPLTATLTGPAEHDGSESFEVRLTFSMEPDVSYKTVRDTMFTVTGGTISGARRVKPPHDREFDIVVKPSGDEAVSFSLVSPLPACGETGSVCTAAGRMIEGTVSTRIPGPAALSVADATVREGPGSVLAFVVTLDRARSQPVTVDYVTVQGTGAGAATEGADYTRTSGTLTFAAGDTEETVSVPVLADAHDEGAETMTLTLTNPVGARIADGTATGTIENTGPIPKAWIARFGRTVADQVLDAVGERMRGGSAASTRLTLGGHEVLVDADWPNEGEARGASFLTGEAADASSSRVSLSELLLASSFHLASAAGTGNAPRWSLWGRGARSSFNGRDGELTLDGDVLTGLVGADYESGKALLGVALAWSAGDGSYKGAGGDGELESKLASLYPYLRYTLSERLSVWGAVGMGEGNLTLKTPTGEKMETGLSLAMAAWRLRLVLEGSREVNFGGASLTPSVQVGMRYDGGDAETGAGVELGGGVRFAASGLTMEVRGRGLLAHKDRDYEEWGVSASAVISPGSEGRGLSMRVGSAWGAASSRADRVWTGGAAGLAGEADLPGASLDAEVAYGLDALSGLLTPYTGVALSENGETWRAGARWTLGPAVTFSLEAILIEPASGS